MGESLLKNTHGVRMCKWWGKREERERMEKIDNWLGFYSFFILFFKFKNPNKPI